MKGFLLAAATVALATSANAAGIDPRAFSCADLHATIAAQHFVFIAQPFFGDFVVSSAYYCSGGGQAGERLQLRSVPARDTPECPVYYCERRVFGRD